MFDTGTVGSAANQIDPALAELIKPVTLADEHRLPILPAFERLIPGGGLRRGSTLSVDGPAATSLALAATSAASQDGAWVAAIGFDSLGLAAAMEMGIAIGRFVLVAAPDAEPGPDSEATLWATAVAALVDAFDVVLVRSDTRVRTRDARRLAARVRERDAVLVQVGSGPWPELADVTLTVPDGAVRWEGLEDGHGHLQGRRVTVVGGGRREAARPRTVELWLPSPDGEIEVAPPAPVELRGA